jgi:hypothetical protein
LLLLDTFIAGLLYFGGRYLAPDAVEEITFLIGILQPVFVAIIVAIAWEDNSRRAALKAEIDQIPLRSETS